MQRKFVPLLSWGGVGKRCCELAIRYGLPGTLLLGLAQSPAAAQAGKNGAFTVTASGTIVNEYTALTADAAMGATTITVANSALKSAVSPFGAALAAGDLLLLVQPQGATISTADDATYGTVTALNNAGRYQLVEVAAVPTATNIELSCKLFSAYSAGGHAQVVRVPRYTTLALNGSTSVKASAWNGTTGGVLAIETTGNVTLGYGAKLDVSGLGFRGGVVEQNSDAIVNSNFGYRSLNDAYGAEKGESIAGTIAEYDALNGRYGRGAPANGGGGGNSHNAAGGGGANAAVPGAVYTGKGNPDPGPKNGYAKAWNLEVADFAISASTGGGRGGYSFSKSNQDALMLGPGQVAWSGDQRQNKGGLGGHPIVSTGRAFFGGGGAGDSNNSGGTSGANGGGFLYLAAGGTISCSNNNGQLLADGSSVTVNSANDAPGGGGGGGTIMVQSTGLTGVALLARGGKGGGQGAIGTEAEGTGGGGGGGLVSYTSGTPTTDVSGGLNGATASASFTEFPPNGGTRGGAGRVVAGACSLAPLCPAAVADVATSISFSANPLVVGQSAVINVGFANIGANAADNVTRTVQLPASLGVGAVAVSTGMGTGSYNNSTGQVTFTTVASLASGSNANATISYTPSAGGTVAVSSAISTATSQGCQTDDDNSGASNLLIYPVDLQVTLSGPATAAANSTVTYTATVQNMTPINPSTVDATNTVLTVQLAKGLLATSFPAGTVYNFDTGIATLAIGQVNRGAAAQSYNFTFTLPNNNQPVAGAAWARATEPDPDATNSDGIAGTMRVATTVTLPPGTCAGTTHDGTPATQGLYAEYFKGYFNNVLTYFDAPNSPDMSRTEGNVSYAASNAWGDLSDVFGSGSVTNPDAYSARYQGYLTVVAAGSYTFSLVSDEAAYLWVSSSALASPLVAADALVKDPGPHLLHTSTSTSTPVALTAGTHPLLALYGELAGANLFTLQYAGPDTGGTMVTIPASALCSQVAARSPLPVTLTAFTAQAAGRAARLSWRTASELHNDHFDVERSRDGIAFAPIGRVQGAGTSTAAHDYSFSDGAAAPAGGGTIYYRLHQVDTDSSSHFSPVRAVNWGVVSAAETDLQLYPNPAAHRVRVVPPLPAAGTVRIIDLAGRVVITHLLAAEEQAPELDLRALPAGLYLVQLEQSGKCFTQRLLHTAE